MTREEAIKELEFRSQITGGTFRKALNMAIKALQEPEIVHCNDCKYWIGTRIGEEELKQCSLAGYLIGERGYCLYGKKAG